MPAKAMRAKKPNPRPRTTTRSAVSGRFGTGEREAEKLAWRIWKFVCADTADDPIDAIKAMLLSAVTVRESRTEPLAKGYVYVPNGKVWADGLGRIYVERDWICDEDMYVALVPVAAPAPKPPKARRGKERE